MLHMQHTRMLADILKAYTLMNFIDISTLNITTELDVLKRDTQRYSSFLYQHKGVFFADNTRIGNNDPEEAKTKFINVLTKAKEENISLVLSPEYSCPKSVIDEIIANPELQPSQQKLWALGGESLNKVELNYFRDLQSPNIHIQFEDCFTNSDKKYVDPLYYIFKGQFDGFDKLIILIQFKSHHMGVWSGGQIESDNIILGNNIYIIKNNNTSTRLISFICSEAMNVSAILTQQIQTDILWVDMPFLILNPQINPDPSHEHFVSFRKFILENEKKELITLNWGKETYYNEEEWYSTRGNTARSSIFFKTNELNCDKDFIEKNHTKGIYFLHINVNYNKYVFYLNSIPELFHIEHNAVHINTGTPTQRRREGPKIITIYTLNEEYVIKDLSNVNDNHIANLNERGVINTYFLDETKSIIDKEILVNILTGKVQSKKQKSWSNVIHLNSFSLRESDECNNRLTYIEDTYENSKQIRKSNCEYISKLDTIIKNKAHYPSSIEDLKQKDVVIAYPNTKNIDYRHNIIEANGTLINATICFVGNETKTDASFIYNNIRKLFDPESTKIRRVVVFYTNGEKIEKLFDPKANLFTETHTDPTSITNS
jgi:hypothetical protein